MQTQLPTRAKEIAKDQELIYRHPMASEDRITAAEATTLLGYKNRSSLTRRVQAGDIAPVFTASGERGEQFFDRAEVMALKAAGGATVVGGVA